MRQEVFWSLVYFYSSASSHPRGGGKRGQRHTQKKSYISALTEKCVAFDFSRRDKNRPSPRRPHCLVESSRSGQARTNERTRGILLPELLLLLRGLQSHLRVFRSLAFFAIKIPRLFLRRNLLQEEEGGGGMICGRRRRRIFAHYFQPEKRFRPKLRGKVHQQSRLGRRRWRRRRRQRRRRPLLLRGRGRGQEERRCQCLSYAAPRLLLLLYALAASPPPRRLLLGVIKLTSARWIIYCVMGCLEMELAGAGEY